jgi:hypothetical protein
MHTGQQRPQSCPSLIINISHPVYLRYEASGLIGSIGMIKEMFGKEAK